MKYGPIDEPPLQEAARLRRDRRALRAEVKRLRGQLDALQQRVADAEDKERVLATRVVQLSELVRKIRGLVPKRDIVCPRPVIVLKY